jgi:hypothetical protein
MRIKKLLGIAGIIGAFNSCAVRNANEGVWNIGDLKDRMEEPAVMETSSIDSDGNIEYNVYTP